MTARWNKVAELTQQINPEQVIISYGFTHTESGNTNGIFKEINIF